MDGTKKMEILCNILPLMGGLLQAEAVFLQAKGQIMNPSQRNRLANKQSHRRSFSKKCKNSVRLFIEELETRAVPSISASGTTITATEGMGFNGVVATFTDTDVGATINNFTTLIAWGDGTTSVGTVEATNTGFQVTGSHAYADEGSPSVSVTINDIDGSSATATTTAQVADNDALTATSYGLSGVGHENKRIENRPQRTEPGLGNGLE
jgi:hypothetical protein